MILGFSQFGEAGIYGEYNIIFIFIYIYRVRICSNLIILEPLKQFKSRWQLR